MPRIIITGAAGFIGMHTSVHFLSNGWDVVGIDNLNDYYDITLKRDRLKEIEKTAKENNVIFTFIQEDLNSQVWSKINPKNIDGLIHLAAQAGVRYSLENPQSYLESNIIGFQRVLEFVKSAGISRFVYASSSSVYGKCSNQPFDESQACNNPESYYAATKMANELMARSYGNMFSVSSVGLRFFTVYGPFGRPDMAPMLFANAALLGKSIKIYNHGNQKRDFTFIDDIVEGIHKIISLEKFPKKPLILNIGNGNPVNLMRFIELIETEMNISLKKNFVDAQKGDVAETFASTTRLKELTGYKPSVSLEYGIKKFIDWFKLYNAL